MMHDPDNLEKLKLRKGVMAREWAAHFQDPENFNMAAAPLIAASRPHAAERLGIFNPKEFEDQLSHPVMLYSHLKFSKPQTIKSETDGIMEKGLKNGVQIALERRRTMEHLKKMQDAGHTRASAAPRAMSADSAGTF